MKIAVGKNYEGTSNPNHFTDGDYEFQIVNIESTKGRVKMTLATSDKRRAYKTFFLLDKDGKEQNERGIRELADFVTTAMQIEDEETEVEIEDCLGYYLICTIKNSSYEQTDPETGAVQTRSTYYINKPSRLDEFSDGTPSLIERKAKQAPVEKEEEETQEEELPFDPDAFFGK